MDVARAACHIRDTRTDAPAVSEPYLFPAITSAGGSDHLVSNNFANGDLSSLGCSARGLPGQLSTRPVG